MSKNIDQVYQSNPITSNQSNDLMYFGRSPYGSTNDTAMLYSNFSQGILSFINSNNYGSNTSSFSTNLTLTNPISTWNILTASTTGLKLILPAMNTSTSYPVGKIFFIVNNGSNAFSIYSQDTTTVVLSSLLSGQVLMIELNNNSTANGTFTYQILGTIASQQSNNVTILGGSVSNVTTSNATIDNSPIGSSLPDTGAFTTLASNTNLINVINGTISTLNSGTACSDLGYTSVYATVQTYQNGSQIPLGIVYNNIASNTIGQLIKQGYVTVTLASSGITSGTILYFAEDGSGSLTTSSGHWIAGVVLNNISSTSYNIYLSIYLNPVGISSQTTATTFNNKNQGIRLGDQVDFTNSNPKTITLDGSGYAANGTFYWYLTNSGSGTITIAAASGNATYGPTTIAGGNGQYQTPAVRLILFNIAGTSTWYIDVLNGFNLVAGTNMSFSFASNGITLNSTGAVGFTNVTQSTSTATLSPNSRYIISNGSSLVTLTLPVSSTIGDTYEIIGGSSGGWKVAQNASQIIHFGNQSTTSGTGGSLSSSNQYDKITISNIGTNTYSAYNSQGNVNYV